MSNTDISAEKEEIISVRKLTNRFNISDLYVARLKETVSVRCNRLIV